MDAGNKALAADAGHPMCDVLGAEAHFEPLFPSEEHLPVAAPEQKRPNKGDLFYLFPKHVCPTVNLAEAALLVDGPLDGTPTFSEIPIEARAHPLFLDEPTVQAGQPARAPP